MEASPFSAAKPDGRRLRGERSRQAVLDKAVAIAKVEGLEGLTFGRVAIAAGVPKSTLQAMFKDRAMLQLQTLGASTEQFSHEVRKRLPLHGTAFGQLKALSDAWFDLAGDASRPGGCLVTAAAHEYRARPGPIQDYVAELRALWHGTLLAAAEAARQEGALAPDCVPEQLVFEILAFEGAAMSIDGFARARASVDALLDRARGPAALRTGGSAPR